MEKKILFLDVILASLAYMWALQKIVLQVLPLAVVGICSKLSSYAISKKNNEPTLGKWQKN